MSANVREYGVLAAALATALLGMTGRCAGADERLPYTIVDTGQDRCFSNRAEIEFPKAGEAFFGQDAAYQGNAPAYRDNGDGTVSDLNTGLMWQKTPDGGVNNKKGLQKALADAKACRTGGYSDWRLPSIKELYSLIDFRGYSMRSAKASVPYMDTQYFDFAFGRSEKGERVIDAQFWSATQYLCTTMGGNDTAFGVNFADGRIKGYPISDPRGRTGVHCVRYVRGNPDYGKNDFVDNGDGTVTDRATGLQWMLVDSGKTMTWQEALAWSENLEYAGHSDWRLPNAKELQSIVDYERAPLAKGDASGPAIDPIFKITETESWFWTSTTHLEHRTCSQAAYIAFGQAFGYRDFGRGATRVDVHGAGAQRSDPKEGDAADYPTGRGPQGDEVRIRNYVRCVRGGDVKTVESGPKLEEWIEPGGRPSFLGRLDKDGDGKVSREEFDGPAREFPRLDKNNDGFLSEDEAPERPLRRR